MISDPLSEKNVCSEILTAGDCECRVELKLVDSSPDAGVDEYKAAVGATAEP